MRESPGIWQPQRRDLESFLCVFSPLLLFCLQMERGLFLPCYWIWEFAVTRGPREDHIAPTRMQPPSRLLADRLVYGNRFAQLVFWEKLTFFRDTVNAVRAAETSGSRNVGMEGADFDSPSPTGVWSPTSRVWDLREWNFVALGYRYEPSGKYYKVGNADHLAVPATWPRLLMRPLSRKAETPNGRG